MSFHNKALLSALLIATASPAWAFGGGAGCADLPEYARAQGALEGMTGACDMSVERARQITAAHDAAAGGPAGLYDPAELRRMQSERAAGSR